MRDVTEQRDAADEGRLEPCGTIIAGTVIVNEGKVVRPSQLIASVRRLSRGGGMHRRAAGMALSIVTLVSAPRATFGEGLIQDSHYPIQTCAGDALPPRVERLLKPVLLARAAANRANEEWDTTYESAFYKLLQMKGADARQAQVALMAYYTGEHYGEELLELARSSPKQFDPLIRRYRQCRPRLTFEQELSGVVVLQTLYRIYLKEL